MKRRSVIKKLSGIVPFVGMAQTVQLKAMNLLQQDSIAKGPFKPNWESLQQYKVPNWYTNAKFGIWAHWGPQCQPEAGDWYAREMYMEGSDKYKFHLKKYGHPSVFGFKDVIHEWKAENWDPEALMKLYKQAGAQYFVALANHHDNLDLYKSQYQSWNSLNVGPKKDIVGGWAEAARKAGLHFGVSVHAAHAWSWFETAQRSDKSGPYAGVAYDGKLSAKEGKGKWWQGLDPQELYAQNHPLSINSLDNGQIHKQWNWGNGVSVPNKAYCEKFFLRTIDLIDKYSPDLVYFDDTVLPLWPVNDAGLRIAAHLYNKSIREKGSVQTVINGKILDEKQRQCMVWDIERGQSNTIEPFSWQTDTCIGGWHYDRSLFERHGYKTARTVIHTLIDVVSKNGNLLLSVPIRGDGTIDSDERAIVEEIGRWMQKNSESIYETKPWKVFGEGPAMDQAAPLNAQGFNEGKGKPFTGEDIRFVTKGDILYATLLGWPQTGKASIKGLTPSSFRRIQKITLLGNGQELVFEQSPEGTIVTFPESKPDLSYANVLKIS